MSSLRHVLSSHRSHSIALFLFFFNDTATTEIYTLSLHDALPILFREFGYDPAQVGGIAFGLGISRIAAQAYGRSEEHTSELQSRRDLVCRLLLEKKKKKRNGTDHRDHVPIYQCDDPDDRLRAPTV